MKAKLLLTWMLLATLLNLPAKGQRQNSGSKTFGPDYQKELTRLTTLVDHKDQEIARIRQQANDLTAQLEILKKQQNQQNEPAKSVWNTEPQVQADDLLDNVVSERQKTYQVRRNYIRGSRGGCYYINGNGNKTYVDRSLCN